MSSYTQRTITTVRTEFCVPAPPPFGANSAEMGKAWTAADRAYRQANSLPAEVSLPDNAITFRPGDDEVILSFETRSEA